MNTLQSSELALRQQSIREFTCQHLNGSAMLSVGTGKRQQQCRARQENTSSLLHSKVHPALDIVVFPDPGPLPGV